VIRRDSLRKVLATIPSESLRRVFFRAVLLKFSRDPLGRKRPIVAQRFNADRGARVLYLADRHETALAEVRAFGIPLMSFAIVPVQVDLRALVDLTEARTRRVLRMGLEEIRADFRASKPGARIPTQVLGEACARSCRIDGILYPSLARPAAVNLAVIERSLRALQSTVVVDDIENRLHDRLP
jgi:RES domain-containing protein